MVDIRCAHTQQAWASNLSTPYTMDAAHGSLPSDRVCTYMYECENVNTYISDFVQPPISSTVHVRFYTKRLTIKISFSLTTSCRVRRGGRGDTGDRR